MSGNISQKFTLLSLFRFSIPAIVMLIFTSLYTAVDGVFISRFVGSDALSAINIVLPVDTVVCGIGIMLGTGGSAVIGRKLGAGREEEARKDFTLVTLFSIAVGAVLTLLVLCSLRPIMGFLGASHRLFPYCVEYGRILFLFAVPYIVQMVFSILFLTASKPRLALWLTITSGVLNLALDYFFIVVCNMGIGGAAWGTAISRCLGGFFPLFYFARKIPGLRFRRPRLDWGILGEVTSNGSSEMVSNIATGVTTFLFNLTMMDLVGEDGVAAMTIVLYTQFIFSAVFLGFSTSAAPVISFNYGSGDTSHLQKLFRYCLVIVGGCTLFMLLAALLLADPLITLFTPRESTVFALARHGYMIFIWNFLFSGFNIFASSFFTALSNGRVSAFISFLRTLVFIVGAILTLPRFLGLDGLWMAVPAAELLTALVAAVLLLRLGGFYQYLPSRE